VDAQKLSMSQLLRLKWNSGKSTAIDTHNSIAGAPAVKREAEEDWGQGVDVDARLRAPQSKPRCAHISPNRFPVKNGLLCRGVRGGGNSKGAQNACAPFSASSRAPRISNRDDEIAAGVGRELVPWSVRSRTTTVRCQRKCRAVFDDPAGVARPESLSARWIARRRTEREPNVDDSREERTAAMASRLSQLKENAGPYLGAGPAKSGDHSTAQAGTVGKPPNRAGSIRKRDGRWRTERAHKSGVFAAIQHRSNACRRQLTRTKKISVLSVSLLRKVAPLHR